MAKNLAQNFVSHGNVGFTPNVISELSFNHHHRGFHIAALMVVGKKLFAVEREVVKHLFPSRTSVRSGRIGFESDVWGRPIAAIAS